jgi:hypothetical protein
MLDGADLACRVQDGGYNQPVAAQYTDALNPRVTPRRSPGDAPRPAPSVLCPPCQLRQEAVVRAMAAFEPANEVCMPPAPRRPAQYHHMR